MSERPTLLYLLAPSYSGSTLLTYLLSQHDRIATIGELKATRMGDVDRYDCSCGTRIRECAFWQELARRAADRDVEFSVDDFGTVFGSSNALLDKVMRATVRGPWFERLRSALLALAPGAAARRRAIARRNFVLGQVVCEMQDGDIFLDGSKDAVRLRHFIDAGLWDIRVIYLQRDGRGVTNSYRKHDDMSRDRAIDYWLANVRELERMRARLPGESVFDLRYEDLCREPARTMSELWRWLGIAERPLEALAETADKSHILGNRMRLTNVAEIRYDESWRRISSADDLERFAERAGHVNRQLGYA